MNKRMTVFLTLFLALFFLGGISSTAQEAPWHQGSTFGKDKRFVSHDIVEYKQGQIWIVGGLAEDGKLYYFIRTWEEGQTVESPAKLISDQIFPKGTTVKIFVSEKDGFIQFSVSTEGGILCFWITPEELFPRPPPPPPPPCGYPDPIPVFHAHALNSWQWFYTNAWDNQEEIEDEAKKLVHELKMHRVALHDGFLWLSSGNPEHLIFNHKTPWMWDGEKFRLDIPNPRFWELAESWLRIHKDVELDYAWHLWMWYEYNLLPFRINDKGIVAQNLLDPRIWKYQEAMMRKVMELYQKVYGADYNPYVKIGNEFDHAGSGKLYHEIMYFFEDCWNVLKDYTIPEHCIIDMHKSEGTIGELRDPFDCPKPGQCDRGKRHGDVKYGRRFIQEIHGFSVKEDFLRKVEHKGKMWPLINLYLAGRNPYRRFTEDCGSWPLKLGKGATWYPQDSGLPTHHRNWADADQSYEMAKYVFGHKKNHNRSRIILGWYPVECIKVHIENGVERHTIDHRVEVIDWSRPKAIVRAWEEGE